MSSVSPAAISLRGYNVWIGQRQILFDLAFDVNENEVTAIIGQSGSGKSVLLKSLVGLLQEEIGELRRVRRAGEILYRGHDISSLSGHNMEYMRSRVVYVSQRPVLFAGSIIDNLVIPLRYWRPSILKSERDDLIEVALRSVRLFNEIEGRALDDAKSLSAGQIQRLCIARAMVLQPDVLLLDEPTANIDPIGAAALEELVGDLREKVTMLVVTHNMQQAARISQRTMHMFLGKLIEYDDTDQTLQRSTGKHDPKTISRGDLAEDAMKNQGD